MPYSDELKAVFLHVPKTGGTAIRRMLGIKSLQSDNPDQIPSPQHLTCALLRKELGPEKYDSYFKFTVVRNPWSRLVSEYHWRQRGPRRRLDIGFGEFTRYAEQRVRTQGYYEERFGDHFIPQVEYTRDVDRVVRFERFAEGITEVAQALGIEPPDVGPKPARRYDRYWEYYDQKSRQRVADIYSADIEAFGYEFEG